MLHTKYQGSRPCGFRQEDLFHVSLYKHVALGAWPFLAPGTYIEQTW